VSATETRTATASATPTTAALTTLNGIRVGRGARFRRTILRLFSSVAVVVAAEEEEEEKSCVVEEHFWAKVSRAVDKDEEEEEKMRVDEDEQLCAAQCEDYENLLAIEEYEKDARFVAGVLRALVADEDEKMWRFYSEKEEKESRCSADDFDEDPAYHSDTSSNY
jgi:hypothetical protein